MHAFMTSSDDVMKACSNFSTTDDDSAHAQSKCTENLMKSGIVVFEICERTERQTYRETDRQLITILLADHASSCTV